MQNYPHVRTIEDFHTLDESDVLIGYMDGFAGGPAPVANHSRSYCHGWRNGMVDGCQLQPDADQVALTHAFEELVPFAPNENRARAHLSGKAVPHRTAHAFKTLV